MNVQTRIPLPTLFDDTLPVDHAQLELLNPKAVIGDNHPPADEVAETVPAPVAAKVRTVALDGARSNYLFVTAFLAETPVIENIEHATKAANFIEQGRKTIQDLTAERRAQTDPLNAQIEAITEPYRIPAETIKGLLDELKRRLKTFTDAEEARRVKAAEVAAAAAAEAERVAREAEAAEQQAMLEADCGVVVDVGAAIVDADKAFGTFKKLDRAAVRAAKATKARFNGGFGRAVSMRNQEELVLDDVTAAIKAMGVTEKIMEAVLSSARDHRKFTGALPAGVRATTERKF